MAVSDRIEGDAALLAQHGARNALALVQSIYRRTLAAGGPAEDMIDHFGGRLDALTRAARSGERIDLEEVIRGELRDFMFGEDPRITIEGPDTLLRSALAQPLGLAFHELVTNSLKFGALSSERHDSRLSIAWWIADGEVTIDWVESGVAIVRSAPARIGFGHEYLTDGLAFQVGAPSILDLQAGRLHWRIRLPTTSILMEES